MRVGPRIARLGCHGAARGPPVHVCLPRRRARDRRAAALPVIRVLSNGDPATTDGAVRVTVDGLGAFGRGTGAGDAVFNPPGPSAGAQGTTFTSNLYLNAAQRLLADDCNGQTVQVISESPLHTRTFVSGLQIDLTQELAPVAEGGSTLDPGLRHCSRPRQRKRRSASTDPGAPPGRGPSVQQPRDRGWSGSRRCLRRERCSSSTLSARRSPACTWRCPVPSKATARRVGGRFSRTTTSRRSSARMGSRWETTAPSSTTLMGTSTPTRPSTPR